MQVKPIIQRVINQLAIDCDKFFDEVAEKNEQIMKDEEVSAGPAKEETGNSKKALMQRDNSCGLSKSLFFRLLSDYGVRLTEQDVALFDQVFGMKS